MNIITSEEFFKLVNMFNGLPDDQAMACEVYNNSNFEDKDVLDLLMCKALMFSSRKYFIDAIKMKINIDSLYTKNIYTFIKPSVAQNIYINILETIINNKE